MVYNCFCFETPKYSYNKTESDTEGHPPTSS